MRRYLVIACLTLSGCSATPQPRPNGPVPLSPGSIESFSALVPGSEATPRCEDRAGAPVEPGERTIALVYPGAPEQQVTVTLNRDGVPTRYVDVRGDLSVADDRAGDRTTIGLYLRSGYAVLSNRPEGGEPQIFEVPLEEALSSERLGNPGAKLEHLLSTCAGVV